MGTISEFHFRGARVISRVIDDLLESGMKHATHVLVTGTRFGSKFSWILVTPDGSNSSGNWVHICSPVLYRTLMTYLRLPIFSPDLSKS